MTKIFGRKKRDLLSDHIPQRKKVEEANLPFSFQTKHFLMEKAKEQFETISHESMSSDEIRTLFLKLVQKTAETENIFLNSKEEEQYARLLKDDMFGLGPLEPLLEDDKITDIFVNGPFDILIEKDGQIHQTFQRFRDEKHLLQVAQRIAQKMGRRVDASQPMVDARLDDDSRVNIILPPLSLTGITLSIRKFRKLGFTIEKMVEKASLSQKMVDFLKLLIESRFNILISGGTGVGKTTFLNALSSFISPNERIISIEDTAELRLMQPHVVRLETRPPNIEHKGEVSIRDLVRNALRMRPDRIIVGEVRGAEVIDMLQALNTGHQGSMSTIHANEPQEALIRLENMAFLAGLTSHSIAVKDLIRGAIDIVIHLERMQDGKRRLVAISEILDQKGSPQIELQDLFRLDLKSLSSSKPTYIHSMQSSFFLKKAEKMNKALEILSFLKDYRDGL